MIEISPAPADEHVRFPRPYVHPAPGALRLDGAGNLARYRSPSVIAREHEESSGLAGWPDSAPGRGTQPPSASGARGADGVASPSAPSARLRDLAGSDSGRPRSDGTIRGSDASSPSDLAAARERLIEAPTPDRPELAPLAAARSRHAAHEQQMKRLRAAAIDDPAAARGAAAAGAAIATAQGRAVSGALARYVGPGAAEAISCYWAPPAGYASAPGFYWYPWGLGFNVGFGWGNWGWCGWPGSYWPGSWCWWPSIYWGWYSCYQPYGYYYHPAVVYSTVVYDDYDDPDYVVYQDAPQDAQSYAEPSAEGEGAWAPEAPENGRVAPAEPDLSKQGVLNSAAMRYLDLGDAAFRERRYNDAVQFYSKAVEFMPDQGVLYLVLSDALLATGDYHYAAYCIRRALELDPTLASAAADKHEFYADPGEFDRQLAVLELFVNDHPLDDDARLVLAANYLFGGRPQAAVHELNSVYSSRLRGESAGSLMLAAAEKAQYGAADAADAAEERPQPAPEEPATPARGE